MILKKLRPISMKAPLKSNQLKKKTSSSSMRINPWVPLLIRNKSAKIRLGGEKPSKNKKNKKDREIWNPHPNGRSRTT